MNNEFEKTLERHIAEALVEKYDTVLLPIETAQAVLAEIESLRAELNKHRNAAELAITGQRAAETERDRCREERDEALRHLADAERISKANTLVHLENEKRLREERDEARQAATEYEYWIKNIGKPAQQANAALLEGVKRIVEDVPYSDTPAKDAAQIAKRLLAQYDTAQPTAPQLRPVPMTWIDGAPPDFTGQERVWVVAEIPSRWNLYSSYQCFLWFGPKGWTNKEVQRASRWTPLPQAADTAQGEDKTDV